MISVHDLTPSGDLSITGLSTKEVPTSSQTDTSISEENTRIVTKLPLNKTDDQDLSAQAKAAATNQVKDGYEELLCKKIADALKTNNEGDEAKPCELTETQPTPKKNARKKRNKVKIPTISPSRDQNQTQFSPGASPNTAAVQDFVNYGSPGLSNANPRYLENLTYHPQFQISPRNMQQNMQAFNMQQNMQAFNMQQNILSVGVTQSMQAGVMQQTVLGLQQTINSASAHHARYLVGRQHSVQNPVMQHTIRHRQHPVSAPTTPLVMHHGPSTGSIPNSPNTGFYQNMLQHPLLSHSYVQSNINTNAQHLNTPAKEAKESPTSTSSKHRNKRNSNINETKPAPAELKTFEPYMSAEEVEAGLKNNTLHEGVLRINPKQFQHAYISTLDREEQDIFIDGIRNRNRAFEGDVVVVMLVEVTKEVDTEKQGESDKKDKKSAEKETKTDPKNELGTEKEQKGENYKNENSAAKESKTIENEQGEDKKEQKRGKVVFIKVKVHPRTCVGNLKLMPDKSRQRALFVPRDFRIPRLNIPFTNWPDNFYQDAKKYESTLFQANIISWFDTRFAVGKIIANIGQTGNMKTETLAILAENDLDITPFGPEVRDLFPQLDYTIPVEEIAKREDCRNLCLFSIDPSNCRDIDDAVSCKELCNGNYEIGVHISDVAHYLTEGTILDEKVAQKATTIYLVERAYHMLPDELCMLCSLFPGVDKLAFSVFWEITKQGEVLSHRFAKTVINSCCQLAYEHAQEILDGKDNSESSFPETYNNFKYEEIRKSVEAIGKIAAIFRHNRFEGGALRIDQPKIAFRLNPINGLPDQYSFYEIKESHQMIEEFMLLANGTVAQRIYDDHPNLAFLRCHPTPSGFMLKQLAKALDPMGIKLDISSAGALHRSLLPYNDPATCDKGRLMVLNMLCTKPMMRAKYFCAASCDDDDFLHYALNIPIYTHFTSPIRRYADIMVHRLLAASLKFRDNPKWEVDAVRKIAAQCNKQKYNAKKAGEMSSDLYMLKYIEMHSPIQTEAVVVEVREKCIDVIVVAMGLNRRIFFNPDFPGEFNCIKHECGSIKMSKMEVKWQAVDDLPETSQVIEVFSILQVHLHKADDMVKVETKLIRPQ